MSARLVGYSAFLCAGAALGCGWVAHSLLSLANEQEHLHGFVVGVVLVILAVLVGLLGAGFVLAVPGVLTWAVLKHRELRREARDRADVRAGRAMNS